MSAARKWISIGVGAVVLLMALIAAFIDPLLRHIAVQTVTGASGRQLAIAGDFNVDFFPWPPRVRAEGVSFANAEWGTEPMMLEVEVLEFTIEVLALLRGELVAPEVIASSPRVVLERREGRRNWILSRDQSGAETGVHIGRLVVNGGALTYRDPAAKTELYLGIATNPESAQPDTATTFSVNGRLRGVPLSASGSGGEVLALRDTSQPFPIDMRFQLAAVRGTVDGTVSGLTALSALDLAVNLSGKNLAQLRPLVDVAVDVPAFKVAGQLSHREQQWSISRFDASIGDSHLAGSLQVDFAGAKPMFGGNVSSKLIDFDTLDRVLESNAKENSQTNGGFKRLREVNGKLQFALDRIRDAPLPLDSATGTLQVRDGVATVDLSTLGLAGGRITSNVRVDATQTPSAAQVSARIEGMTMSKLFPSSSLAHGIGALGGKLQLTAQGDSYDRMLSTADGSAEFVITGGEIGAPLLELLQLDPGSVLRYMFGSRSNVPLECAIAQFKIDNGVMRTQTFVIDTPSVTVVVEGTINLAGRTLDLTAKPVSSGFRLFSAPVPVHISGSFSKPDVQADTSSVFARGGAALLLGLINPLAALLPLIDLGGETAAQCSELLKKAEAAKPGR